MRRREMLKTLGLAGAAMMCPGGLRAAEDRPRLNVLLLLTDDQRTDAVGALGNRFVQTPNMDKLVGRGMIFRRAYTQGSFVGAVCVPSRTMILTGRNLFRLQGDKPAKYASTFARTMKSAGYATLRTGKQGSSPDGLYPEFDQSFTITRSDTCARTHADHAIAFIREQAGKKPFFAYVEFATPHDPQPAPAEYLAKYKAEDLPLPPNFLPQHPFDNGEMTVRDEQTLPWPRTKESVTGKLARYYASVTWTDAQVGRILQALEESGEAGRTLILFASDNGLSLGEHGLLGKQNLYENGGMHVPLVIAGPGIKAGRTGALVYLMDLFPTVCELAGLARPEGVDGCSLAPVLLGRQEKVRDYMFNAYGNVQRSVSDGRWKLIRYPQINKTQLFDLDADPHEMSDLADKPEQAVELARMMALLEQARKDHGDPLPLTVAQPRNAAWAPPEEAPERRDRRPKKE